MMRIIMLKAPQQIASHAGVFRGARFSSLPTNLGKESCTQLSRRLWGGTKDKLP